MTTHDFYMDIALNHARAMKGQTDPNPLVGCVIVNHNRIVGIGTHLQAGEPHAEIHALRMAGEQARGGTLYVTLEPCSHYGRTGPCAETIVHAGIEKVVIATLDPNPIVSGNGVAILKKADIDVEVGICEEKARKMNEVFHTFMVHKRPFITLKTGITMDGKIATHTAHSKWITSEEARKDVHQLRHQHMGVLTGINTVLKDNPALTARIPNGRNPLRIVMDSTLKIPLHYQLIQDQQAETWIFTTAKHDQEKRSALEALGIRIIVTANSHMVNPQEVVAYLGEQGISSLLLEAGGAVNAAFLEQQLIDKLILYMAPKLIGGKEAPTFLEGAGAKTMEEAIELTDITIETIGKDIKWTGYPMYKHSSLEQ
ncbi:MULTISPECIES: bifunctional diaminohydroxyphosphoribosylaminopyrimidine deaminase/5-amino-6-(5-phosphoribosylamino)uracil reductase RibD [Clostridia]|uniref:bifunctional diaminohydroxyphosphoribosylaminopyrimidine deaminase/5-amino-6-(5-phosphoribosylamino)uracil reductase RibD n=1 Tax=Clostridia TaxID=186801 RepID=UPI000EA08B4D|nr:MULTISPECIES: bifunctional diaminohydroxyphosphoribosylaminopyrimidine deaminase/5-amino-6-(5-phosphoribosylamino)uracil reductase RibD [Clostridia]NBJ67952.1 bifunctional diaminohydroxyphosphoribosylaminopyrimidine deaminase/5-amino-6-(5-phosphoribosylamino)uracil reductase RibD [Roseburia sp. 1XD42-34]RKI82398.1 bifunctional diaminohydroxyphosphoribosylaminopyrimidine deaminase/5-amino-6-(5-phosphoribosylamino)uracil reductase RibD [Clostridium sp. 1xD42-85]